MIGPCVPDLALFAFLRYLVGLRSSDLSALTASNGSHVIAVASDKTLRPPLLEWLNKRKPRSSRAEPTRSCGTSDQRCYRNLPSEYLLHGLRDDHTHPRRQCVIGCRRS